MLLKKHLKEKKKKVPKRNKSASTSHVLNIKKIRKKRLIINPNGRNPLLKKDELDIKG